MQEKRGQSSQEVLLTYGWAILMVLVFLGALYYFGVFDLNKLAPNSCTLSPDMECSSFTMVKDEGTEQTRFVMLSFNGLGSELHFEPGSSFLISGYNLGAQGEQEYYGTCKPENVLPGQGFVCYADVSQVSTAPNVGDCVSIDFFVNFSTADAPSMRRSKKGAATTQVEPAPSIPTCGNGACEPALGENALNCPEDCEYAPPAPTATPVNTPTPTVPPTPTVTPTPESVTCGAVISSEDVYSIATDILQEAGDPDCITFTSGSEGSVLDCGGKSLIGAGTVTSGIVIGTNSITIQNCEIRNFGVGIEVLADGDDAVIQGNDVFSSLREGVTVTNADNVLLSGNQIFWNGEEGVRLYSSVDTEFSSNHICLNDLGPGTFPDVGCESGATIASGSESYFGSTTCTGLTNSGSCSPELPTPTPTPTITPTPTVTPGGPTLTPTPTADPSATEILACDPTTSVSSGGSLIDTTGSYVVLSDLSSTSGNCIEVTSGGSGSVIDCQGHNIFGPGDSHGIELSSATDVEVRRCVVSLFNNGFDLTASSSNALIDNVVYDVGYYGFLLNSGSNGNTLLGNSASFCKAGYLSVGSSSNVFDGNMALNNTEQGFYMQTGSNLELTENTAVDNAVGIRFFNCDNTILDDNYFCSNPGDDVSCMGGSFSSVTGNTCATSSCSGVSCTGCT